MIPDLNSATLLGLLAVLAVVLALRGVHLFGPTGRARRAIRRLTRTPRLLLRGMGSAVERRESELDQRLGAHVEAQARVRLAATSIEELKNLGAQRVRWGALRDAGLRTLADVAQLDRRALAAVPGVGATSAGRIVRASKKALKREAGAPPEIPAPDLQAEGALDVGRAALRLLFVRDALEPDHAVFRDRLEGIATRWRATRSKSGFFGWCLRLLFLPARRRAVEELHALEGDLSELLAEEAYVELGRRWKRLREEQEPELLPAAVRDEVAARYATFSALVEAGFERLGLGSATERASSEGGLPQEILAGVQAVELDVKGLRLELRRYQGFGARYLLHQGRTVLGDEMGLGKTIQALAAMTHVWNRQPGARFLVVAPAGLIWNWVREVERFAPFRGHAVHGDEAPEALAEWLREGGVAVTSYATLRNLSEDGAVVPEGEDLELLVADEAHYLKNPRARRTQATEGLIERSKRVALLSGTPLENHPREFLNLIRMVQPKVAANLFQAGNFEQEARSGLRNLSSRFHQLIAGVYLRRNQRDVLSELPSRIDVEEWVDLGPGERRAYAAAVGAGDFMAMRRATTVSVADETSAKFEHLEELFDDHGESGRKVLVFSYFLDVIAEVERRFTVTGSITGKTSPRDRMDLVDRFHAVEGHAVLACQIESAGTGLNLQGASVVVLMEPQLKPTTEEQAIARAHRMGQTQRVLVHRLFASDTIDERLRALVAQKRELFEAYARASAIEEVRSQAEVVQPAQLIAAEQARLGV